MIRGCALLLCTLAFVNADWLYVAHFSDSACSLPDSVMRLRNLPGCQLSPGTEYSLKVSPDGSITFYTVYSDLGENALEMCENNDLSQAITYYPTGCHHGFRIIPEDEARNLFSPDEKINIWDEHYPTAAPDRCETEIFASYMMKPNTCSQLPMSSPFRSSMSECGVGGSVFTNYENNVTAGEFNPPGCAGPYAARYGVPKPFKVDECRTDVAQYVYNYASATHVGSYSDLIYGDPAIADRSGSGPLFIISYDDVLCSNATGATILPAYTNGACTRTHDMNFRVHMDGTGNTVELFPSYDETCDGPPARTMSGGFDECDGGFSLAQSTSEASINLMGSDFTSPTFIKLEKLQNPVVAGGCTSSLSISYLLKPNSCFTSPFDDNTNTNATLQGTFANYTTFVDETGGRSCRGQVVFHAQRSVGGSCQPMGYDLDIPEFWGVEAFCMDFGALDWDDHDDDDACYRLVPGVYRVGDYLMSEHCPPSHSCAFDPATSLYYVGTFNPATMVDPECDHEH